MSTWQYFSNLVTNLKEKKKIQEEEGKRCQSYSFQPNSLKQEEKELIKICMGKRKGQEGE